MFRCVLLTGSHRKGAVRAAVWAIWGAPVLLALRGALGLVQLAQQHLAVGLGCADALQQRVLVGAHGGELGASGGRERAVGKGGR